MIYILQQNGIPVDAETSKPRLYEFYVKNVAQLRCDAEIWYIDHTGYYRKNVKPPHIGDNIEFAKIAPIYQEGYELGVNIKRENLFDCKPGQSVYKYAQDNNSQVRRAKKRLNIKCPTFLAFIFNSGFSDGYDGLNPKDYK